MKKEMEKLSTKNVAIRIGRGPFRCSISFDPSVYRVYSSTIRDTNEEVERVTHGSVIVEAPYVMAGIVDLIYNPVFCSDKTLRTAEKMVMKAIESCKEEYDEEFDDEEYYEE